MQCSAEPESVRPRMRPQCKARFNTTTTTITSLQSRSQHDCEYDYEPESVRLQCRTGSSTTACVSANRLAELHSWHPLQARQCKGDCADRFECHSRLHRPGHGDICLEQVLARTRRRAEPESARPRMRPQCSAGVSTTTTTTTTVQCRNQHDADHDYVPESV